MHELTLQPIGFVRSPFSERAQAPRQAQSERAPAAARIELLAGSHYDDALSDLEGFEHIWALYWFHLNTAWRPKVRPPRSTSKRGVFATRSPYRPNPIGLSLLKLTHIEGLTLHVETSDMLDGTPVLDLKPYIAYADQPQVLSSQGWLEGSADPSPRYDVTFSARAQEQLAFLSAYHVHLEAALRESLALGAVPHAYRRIKRDQDGWLLAHKDWRARFQVQGTDLIVSSIATGYRPRQLAERPELETARRFVEHFGYPGHP